MVENGAQGVGDAPWGSLGECGEAETGDRDVGRDEAAEGRKRGEWAAGGVAEDHDARSGGGDVEV